MEWLNSNLCPYTGCWLNLLCQNAALFQVFLRPRYWFLLVCHPWRNRAIHAVFDVVDPCPKKQEHCVGPTGLFMLELNSRWLCPFFCASSHTNTFCYRQPIKLDGVLGLSKNIYAAMLVIVCSPGSSRLLHGTWGCHFQARVQDTLATHCCWWQPALTGRHSLQSAHSWPWETLPLDMFSDPTLIFHVSLPPNVISPRIIQSWRGNSRKALINEMVHHKGRQTVSLYQWKSFWLGC